MQIRYAIIDSDGAILRQETLLAVYRDYEDVERYVRGAQRPFAEKGFNNLTNRWWARNPEVDGQTHAWWLV